MFVCVGCDLLADSGRSDTLSCSTACRVRAHRNGSLEALRGLARTHDVSSAAIQQARAIDRLRPDLAEQIRVGKLNLDDTRGEVWSAFVSVLARQLEATA